MTVFLSVALAALAFVLLVLYGRERRAHRKLIRQISRVVTGEERSPLSPLYLLSRLEERCREAEERYQDLFRESLRILEGMPLGVVVLNHLNQILFANQEVQALFHTKVHREQDLFLLFRDRGITEKALKAVDTGLSEEVVLPSGRVFRFWGRKGRFFRVLVVQDITDRVRLREMKEELTGNLAHELKTPLSTLRGALEGLGEISLPQEERELLHLAQAQLRRMEELIRDLLELSRIEQSEPEREFLDFSQLVEEEVERFLPQAQGKGLILQYESPSEAVFVEGDRFFLQRMVRNLLDNALRYTPTGGKVEVRVYESEEEAVLEVSDTGVGIPEKDLPRIFERFYRGEPSRSVEHGGTGLGLAIVKHAAEAHGGRVEVFSKVGEGTLFRVFLPRKG